MELTAENAPSKMANGICGRRHLPIRAMPNALGVGA